MAPAPPTAGAGRRITLLGQTSHTAPAAARALGVEIGQIVKSLVFVVPSGDGGHEPIVCLVSCANRVDLARLAAIVGEPSIRRATAREARDLTGFPIGGIPPIGHGHALRAVMDPDLARFRVVWAAAGHDRAVFPVPPATLRALANAVVAPLAEDRPPDGPPTIVPVRSTTELRAPSAVGDGRWTTARPAGDSVDNVG